MPDTPDLGSGISRVRDGPRVMATSHLKEGVLFVIDFADWTVIEAIEAKGPGVLPAQPRAQHCVR